MQQTRGRIMSRFHLFHKSNHGSDLCYHSIFVSAIKNLRTFLDGVIWVGEIALE